MKTTTAKELRQKTAAILDAVEQGAEIVVTRRGRGIARLSPLAERGRPLTATGFGLWRDRADLEDAKRWIDRARAPRFGPSRSTRTS
jgi:prevent-host-death family protein